MGSPLLERIRALAALPGPPGREAAVRLALAEMLRPAAEVLREDAIGNLIAQRRGPEGAPHLLIECHMDEVGLVVREVEPGGAVRFEKVGLVADAVLPGRDVDLLTEDDALHRGVVNITAGHLQALQGQEHPTPSQMWIDTGLGDGEAVRALGIGPGTLAVFVGPFEALGGGAWKSKAVDNRVGCALCVEALQNAELLKDRLTLTVAFCVQEEVGARGASVLSVETACGGPPPDAAVVLDTLNAKGPAEASDAGGVRLGGGPVLRRYDHERTIPESLHGHIAPQGMVAFVREAAAGAGVSLQEDVFVASFTDAATLSRSRPGGIPTANVNLPRRYAHSPVELFMESDLEDMTALVTALLRAAAEGKLPPSVIDHKK